MSTEVNQLSNNVSNLLRTRGHQAISSAAYEHRLASAVKAVREGVHKGMQQCHALGSSHRELDKTKGHMRLLSDNTDLAKIEMAARADDISREQKSCIDLASSMRTGGAQLQKDSVALLEILKIGRERAKTLNAAALARQAVERNLSVRQAVSRFNAVATQASSVTAAAATMKNRLATTNVDTAAADESVRDAGARHHELVQRLHAANSEVVQMKSKHVAKMETGREKMESAALRAGREAVAVEALETKKAVRAAHARDVADAQARVSSAHAQAASARRREAASSSLVYDRTSLDAQQRTVTTLRADLTDVEILRSAHDASTAVSNASLSSQIRRAESVFGHVLQCAPDIDKCNHKASAVAEHRRRLQVKLERARSHRAALLELVDSEVRSRDSVRAAEAVARASVAELSLACSSMIMVTAREASLRVAISNEETDARAALALEAHSAHSTLAESAAHRVAAPEASAKKPKKRPQKLSDGQGPRAQPAAEPRCQPKRRAAQRRISESSDGSGGWLLDDLEPAAWTAAAGGLRTPASHAAVGHRGVESQSPAPRPPLSGVFRLHGATETRPRRTAAAAKSDHSRQAQPRRRTGGTSPFDVFSLE